MSLMTVLPPQISALPEGSEVLFIARTAKGESRVRITHSLSYPDTLPEGMLGDAAVALFLLPAMRLGLSLDIQSPVSAVLKARCGVLQEIFCNWYPEVFTQTVQVTSPVAEVTLPVAARGCFFSGGVDSFFSVLKDRASLERLIFVHGFDLPLGQQTLRKEVSTSLIAAAEALKIPLVEVVTDVRDFSDEHVHWGSHFCGAALASVAHLLSPWIGEVIVPATMTYAHLEPFGTHPYTDERWAGDALKIIHDGLESSRIDKISRITFDPVARDHLRVCWENRDGRYNCGCCEKCLRTIANLRVLRVLDQCPGFPSQLDLRALEAIEVAHPLVLPMLEETRGRALAVGDEELAAALRRCCLRNETRLLARALTPLRGYLSEAPAWIQKTAPRFRDAILKECWLQDPEWTRQEMGRHFSATPEAAFELLWEHDRFWLIRRMIAARLGRLLPRWLRPRAVNPVEPKAEPR
ncbi:MAG: hypothetical protein QE570_09965 [Verrucomicrobiota bacterium]|nr:hypothetical protein [Verrucomicrobiota bacterium]